MSDNLIRLTATQAVAKLRRGEISPLDLIDAAEARIAAVDGPVNALPTICLDRARAHARDLMAGKRREAESEPGWLAGLPVVIKDLADVAGVRTTYGSPIFANHIPTKSHPLVERIERRGGIVIAKSNTPEFGAGGNTFNEVFGHDLHGVEIADSPEAAAAGADAVVIVTEWPQLADVDWAAVGETMRTRVLIDGRNMLDPASLREAGFTVEGIGRAAPGLVG